MNQRKWSITTAEVHKVEGTQKVTGGVEKQLFRLACPSSAQTGINMERIIAEESFEVIPQVHHNVIPFEICDFASVAVHLVAVIAVVLARLWRCASSRSVWRRTRLVRRTERMSVGKILCNMLIWRSVTMQRCSLGKV